MLSFRQIEAFRCLMIAGSSVGAARMMHVTQPAISRLIAELENGLRLELFKRDKGRLIPSDAGLRFYRAVEENFLGMERLEQAARAIRDGHSERLLLGCLPMLASTLLPAVLTQFLNSRRAAPVRVEAAGLPTLLEHLRNHRVDVALCAALPPVHGIETETVLRVRALCALPADHRLCARDVVRADDLRGETLIGWPVDVRLRPQTEQLLFENARRRPRCTIETDTAHTRYAMVAQGLGVSVVEPFGQRLWQTRGVTLRPFEPVIEYEYVLAYPSARRRSAPLEAFRDAVLRVAADYRLDA